MLTTEDRKFITDSINTLGFKLSDDISDLAMMTAKEFQRLEDKVDKGFESVDKRFERVDDKFLVLEQKMDDRFDGVNRRLDDLATNRVRNDIYEGLEKRVHKLEKSVYAKI